MTTLAELRTDVRSRLNESLPGFWDDSELDAWINHALLDVSRRTETLQSYKSYDVVSGQRSYTPPSDMWRIHTVEYRQSGNTVYPLGYVPFHDFQDITYKRRTSGGRSDCYSIWGTPGLPDAELLLYPVPNENVIDGLRVYYYRQPRKLEDDEDIAEIPSGWEDLVPLHVEVTARRKEASDTRWRDAFQLYEQRIDELRRHSRHWTDSQHFMSEASPFSQAWWAGGDDW